MGFPHPSQATPKLGTPRPHQPQGKPWQHPHHLSPCGRNGVKAHQNVGVLVGTSQKGHLIPPGHVFPSSDTVPTLPSCLPLGPGPCLSLAQADSQQSQITPFGSTGVKGWKFPVPASFAPIAMGASSPFCSSPHSDFCVDRNASCVRTTRSWGSSPQSSSSPFSAAPSPVAGSVHCRCPSTRRCLRILGTCCERGFAGIRQRLGPCSGAQQSRRCTCPSAMAASPRPVTRSLRQQHRS